jgi:hypothetical protein
VPCIDRSDDGVRAGSAVAATCPAGVLKLNNAVWHRSALGVDAPSRRRLASPARGPVFNGSQSVTPCLADGACRAWSKNEANNCSGPCYTDGPNKGNPCQHAVSADDAKLGFGVGFGFECAEGHSGALCAVCLGDFFMAANGTCLACDDDRNSVNAVKAIALLATVAVLVAALLWVARKNTELWKPMPLTLLSKIIFQKSYSTVVLVEGITTPNLRTYSLTSGRPAPRSNTVTSAGYAPDSGVQDAGWTDFG